MDVLFLVSRVAHVGLGVFWAGAMIFNAAFLLPAVRDAGPGGAAVAAGLLRRRFTDWMPLAAILTLVSGFYLYWRVSGGFTSAYMGSRMGMVYGTGSVVALVAFVIGVAVMRPAMLRAAALTQGAAQAAAEERERAMAEAQGLRARAGAAGRVVAWLLGAATVAMAIARYVLPMPREGGLNEGVRCVHRAARGSWPRWPS
jgi:uncharacterized membrane protein